MKNNIPTLDLIGTVWAEFYDFKNDFDICAAGGEYTARMDSKWLLIESSCGSGYDDGSEKPIGCTEIREKIMTNIELN